MTNHPVKKTPEDVTRIFGGGDQAKKLVEQIVAKSPNLKDVPPVMRSGAVVNLLHMTNVTLGDIARILADGGENIIIRNLGAGRYFSGELRMDQRIYALIKCFEDDGVRVLATGMRKVELRELVGRLSSLIEKELTKPKTGDKVETKSVESKTGLTAPEVIKRSHKPKD